MDKEEAEDIFFCDVFPDHFREYGADRGAYDQLWVEFVDTLHRNKEITDDQADDWDQPKFPKVRLTASGDLVIQRK